VEDLAQLTSFAAAITAGGIIVVPLEHSYAYACDAFDQSAVARMHELRGAAVGTAAQVLISSVDTLAGVAHFVPDDMKLLAKRFWPGELTLQVAPNIFLTWDLGDAGALGEFAVRVPKSDFILSLLAKTGPLAIASLAGAGQPALREIASNLAPEISHVFDAGVLPAGEASTVVRMRVIGSDSGLEVLRVGAITLAQLREVLPEISEATL
jgi:tRNA threonylcarbamoyl adenosine modification protein (Sua5/YciO/YrdC/YwlC family)